MQTPAIRHGSQQDVPQAEHRHALRGIVLAVLLLFLSTFLSTMAHAQGLQVSYGAKGVQTLSYQGTTLEDTGANPGDTFHIWHIQATDLNGNVISTGEYGWGENNNGETWNSQTQTETYTFVWGTLSTQFVQSGNNLNIIVTEVNNAGSGVILDGAEIFPFALHFPNDPAGFSGYTQYAITTTGPGVTVADYGTGVVTSVIPNESVALYGGWENQSTATYTPIMTSTAPSGLATFLPSNNVPVQQGSSFSYTTSLRFTPEGTAADASDAYASFAATYPNQLTWADKRVIGTAYLASSPSGTDITQPGGYPTNPRRYFNDPTVDITTLSGLQAFQDRILAQAASNVTNAQNMNGQGVITWDIEGEQYPQDTSYVCSPDQIATVAPEMESVITDASTPYAGQKLDDAYFSIMVSAGLRAGVCLRPQVFTFGADDTASQVFLSTNAASIANLENKARFAISRWGVTLFYVDSTVNSQGGTLDPAIFQQLNTDLPNVLFIPEESTPRYYAYSAPFYSFIFHTTLGTPASTYLFYPQAFGANLVNDVSASTLAEYTPQLTASVKSGDILMGHADYWQANDPTIVSIYNAAGVGAPVPTQTAPPIDWAAPAPITYGTTLSAAQLNASSSVAGTFVYSPAAGTVLSAGPQTLLTTFNPADTTHYKPATASVTLDVHAVAPTITEAFGVPALQVGGSTSLTFTITNPDTAAQSGISFADSLPTGMTIGSPNGLSNSCGGAVTAPAGSSNVALTGGSLAASASCTVALTMTASIPGDVTNTTSAISSTSGGTGIPASATLNVVKATISSAVDSSQAGESLSVTGSSTLPLTILFSYPGQVPVPAPTGAISISVDGSTASLAGLSCVFKNSNTAVAPHTNCSVTYTAPLSAGTHMLFYSQAGDANYAATSGSATITVIHPLLTVKRGLAADPIPRLQLR